MKASFRISAFTLACLVALSFVAGMASGLSGDPTRPHDVVLTLELTAFFVAAFVPVQAPSAAARLRRWSAVLLGGSGATVSFLLLTAGLRVAFADPEGAEASGHGAELIALKAASFLVCLVLARLVSVVVLREAAAEHREELDSSAVGEEKHA